MIILTVLAICSLNGYATRYYVNSISGNDNNRGTVTGEAFHSIDKVNSLALKAGDEVLFAAGCTFYGSLMLIDITGSSVAPIIISSYTPENCGPDPKPPIINAKGFLNGILITDCSHIIIKNLTITADAGGFKYPKKKKQTMRCGILANTSKPGKNENIKLENLIVRDVFYEEKGFIRDKNEVRTPNGKQSYGWGIRFINKTPYADMKDIIIQSCRVENVGHTGIKFTGKNKSIHNVKVYDNKLSNTGGPGIQMSGVQNGHISNNQVIHSGSKNDSRKWGRGSCLWTWGCSEIIIEHNSFKNANGPGDSAGCHIDFNCSNVIVQYNLSANNAGGFCEILGNNHNCAYRYNISINDGYRIKGKNGAFQEGKIFWLSGYQGSKKNRNGPFNTYFYNNTIFVNKDIIAKIAVDKASSGVLIANNIFCFEGESKAVSGDQYKPEKNGVSQVKNIVFHNNLYLKSGNWPKEVLIQDDQPVFGNPHFAKAGGSEAENYRPENKKLIKNKGIRIKALPDDSIALFTGLKVLCDFMGNKIKGLPDIGAIEIN